MEYGPAGRSTTRYLRGPNDEPSAYNNHSSLSLSRSSCCLSAVTGRPSRLCVFMRPGPALHLFFALRGIFWSLYTPDGQQWTQSHAPASSHSFPVSVLAREDTMQYFLLYICGPLPTWGSTNVRYRTKTSSHPHATRISNGHLPNKEPAVRFLAMESSNKTRSRLQASRLRTRVVVGFPTSIESNAFTLNSCPSLPL